MKALALAFLFFSISIAKAEPWVTITCSNSDGSVRWESGDEQDLIHLKYSNFIEGVLTLEVDQVNLRFSNTVVLKKRSFRNSQYAGISRVFASKIRVTAADKNPEILRSQFPLNKVDSEVICTSISGDSVQALAER